MALPPLTLLSAVLSFLSPWSAAAPVPKVAPDFTHTGTAEELAKLPFGKTGPTKDRTSSEAQAAKSVAIAVHLLRAILEEGDPIPALFVVKNTADKPHGLWMGFDFPARACHGSCGVTVRNTKTDTVTGPFLARSTMCGGAHWAIPANGYYATSGSVGTGGDGQVLPVGDYELSWQYAGVESNAVKFAVVARKLGRPDPTPRRPLRTLRVQPGEDDKPLAWERAEVTPTPVAELAHALGTGGLGEYHPDLHELPATAGGLRAVAKWDGDALKVTLDSPNGAYDLLDCRKPVVYLLVERATAADELALDRAEEKQAGDRKAGADDLLKLPLTLDLRLPKGWQSTAEPAGDCRVSVVVASREPAVEYAPEGMRQRLKVLEATQKIVKASDADKAPKPKTGDWVLKTEWQALKKPDVRK